MRAVRRQIVSSLRCRDRRRRRRHMGIFPDNAEEDGDALYLLLCKAICVNEPNEASYLSGYVGVILFKVWKVLANNEGDPVKPAGKGGGIYCPYIAINGGDGWIFKEVDEQNMPLPPTYDEVVDAPRFTNVRFRSACRRDEEMFNWFLKLKGLLLMYRIWTACNILGLKAEQFRGITHQNDTTFVSDMVF